MVSRKVGLRKGGWVNVAGNMKMATRWGLEYLIGRRLRINRFPECAIGPQVSATVWLYGGQQGQIRVLKK